MPYKVNAHRREDGNYDLSYGKGSKLITGLLIKWRTGWEIAGYSAKYKTKETAKAAWGACAENAYAASDPDPITTDVAPSPHAGPPKHRKSAFPIYSDIVLDENQRIFFAMLSEKTEPLTLHTVQQARVELRRLLGVTVEETDAWIQDTGGAREAVQRDGTAHVDAPADCDAAVAVPPGDSAASPPQASAGNDRATQDPTIPAVPKYKRPDAPVHGQLPVPAESSGV